MKQDQSFMFCQGHLQPVESRPAFTTSHTLATPLKQQQMIYHAEVNIHSVHEVDSIQPPIRIL